MAQEFKLIERFLSPFEREGRGVLVGPGDDCAVLRPTVGQELCVTADAVIENVHFDPLVFTDADIGHKALAVNLSDLASMGAQPRWFLCSISCHTRHLPRLDGIAKGMAELASQAGIILAGGNFSSSKSLAINITAAGELPPKSALLRSRAKPEDQIYVTGTVGDAALALAQSQRKTAATRTTSRRAIDRQRRPLPRIEAGIVARRFAHAAIDVSDGLVQDIGHVLDASSVGAEIDANLLPLSKEFRRAAARNDAQLDLALSGGEDYELLLFVPPRKASQFERAMAKKGEQVTKIGTVTRSRKLVVHNAPARLTKGFDHFR